MEKKWLINTPQPDEVVEAFRSELKVDKIIAELLLQRGIRTFKEAESFFRPNLDDLHDPFLMQDMEDAVNRLQLAIDEKQRVMLFGDYDVDGTTAVAVLYSFLKDALPLDYYIPDRYKEGYGLSKLGIDTAKKNNVDLIISLDCGIKSVELVDYAKSLGIDFIICDHHTPGEIIPDAIVLNPKRKDCNYPYKELSGCGVGFKLLQGLCEYNNWDQHKLFELLDLVAVSIGADIVEVKGENRILAYHGMKLLNVNPRLAFSELIKLSKQTFPLTLTDVIFNIAPRINAVGRLRSGRFAVELMVSTDKETIKRLAAEINDDNLNRRTLDKEITEEAIAQVERMDKNLYTTVVFDKSWHKGVVGIVASRLIEKYYKPTIVLTESDGVISGSARSIKGFNVYDALSECENVLEQFGGHAFAAGMTLKPENLDAFKQKFEEVARKKITPELKVEEQKIDAELEFDEIFKPQENRLKLPRLKRIISQFEPHGPGNMKPVFISKNVYSKEVRLLKGEHLKISMAQPQHDLAIDGIGFFMAEKEDLVAPGIPFDVVYTLEANKWNGKETLQLNIKDIRATIL